MKKKWLGWCSNKIRRNYITKNKRLHLRRQPELKEPDNLAYEELHSDSTEYLDICHPFYLYEDPEDDYNAGCP